ncbi:MAG: VapC toxin family PIN domain ribonuclease, partial [Candidatus Mcinerneyibacterium aminivorans]
MKKVFLDNDVVLDLLYEREPYNHYANIIFNNIIKNNLNGFVSSIIVANTYYILNTQLK